MGLVLPSAVIGVGPTAPLAWTQRRLHSAQGERLREHVDGVMRVPPLRHPDRQLFPGEFINDVQHARQAAVRRAGLDEVVSADMVGPFRPQPDA